MSESTIESLNQGIEEANLDLCREAILLMAEGLSSMSGDTEKAAISIGDALKQIVKTATDGNLEVKKTLRSLLGTKRKKKSRGKPTNESAEGGETVGVSQIVERQIEIVTAIVNSANAFFEKQLKIAEKANRACGIINAAVKNVETLTKTSNMLSINLRIEASRLDEEEADGFVALGAEVQQFAKELTVATERISSATLLLGDSVPQMRQSTIDVNDKMSTMSKGFDQEVEHVRSRMTHLTESLVTAMDTTESRNNLVLEQSYEILSSLSFQDPLAQGLDRIRLDLFELQNAMEGSKPNFSTVERQKSESDSDRPAAGEVAFF